MRKTLIAFSILTALMLVAQSSFADSQSQVTTTVPVVVTLCPTGGTPVCSCQGTSSCPSTFNNCEYWLNKLESYYCIIGLSDWQKDQARRVVAQFLCDTKNIRLTCSGTCNGSKDDQKKYKRELKKLDSEMKKIVTISQKMAYDCVKIEIKSQVNCCE